ncbi:uncharacterized protein LOC122945678 [Bufo gargarizans]|uniref:uncharacterized protein LOC122945678 n=1 Tax=Bufo gargarizans TaxID=30331 RepID=UPI001CF36F24|nr:uncharacterized protein LOC122945678 [Bufo gargarizans]
MSSVALERGLGVSSELIRQSVSRSTWLAYSSVWSQWEQLLDQVGGYEVVEDFQMLVYFIGLSYSSGVSVSVVSKRVAAVTFWLRLRGLVDVSKYFLVRQALKGYRLSAARPDTRRPVSWAVLQSLWETVGVVCLTPYEVCFFRAAFSLAFFRALRVSELVSGSRLCGGGLLRQDVCFSGEGLRCVLRRSKTDQEGKGVVIILRPLLGSVLCPVRCLEELLAVRLDVVGSLLMHVDGSALSRYQFVAVFRKCLVAAGYPAWEFASHSFRIGAAMEAARWGLGEEAIKRIGRWESRCYRSYVRPHML